MDHFVDERDFRQLAGDRYTFSVLSRVLRGPCSCVRTDHERLILCHTAIPYPVWLWTPDDASPEELERAWRLVSDTLPLSEGYRYNLKYEPAAYFIARAAEEGRQVEIATNMFAYDCPEIQPPHTPTDGRAHVCTMEDAQEAAELIHQFHEELGADRMSPEGNLRVAEQYIGGGGFFLWKNAGDETVACCSVSEDAGLGCVSSVYTKPAWRRRHYAQHLVWYVTRQIAGKGLMPMLYTDADYAASNACYEKIGYVLRGKLCTIAAR